MQPRDVHVYVFDTMADWEVGHAIGYINMPDYQKQPGRYRVRSVGRARESIVTTGGLRVTPDLTLAELKPADSAMLILPGGTSRDRTRDDDPAVESARAFIKASVPVAAICGGTKGLARAGLLDDRAHTSNAKQYLEQQPGYHGAANYCEQRAVMDRGVITAGATAPVDFARAIFAALDMYEPSVLDAWHGLFSTGNAKYFYQLMQAVQEPR
jgi:putative intracellular protease/amidase